MCSEFPRVWRWDSGFCCTSLARGQCSPSWGISRAGAAPSDLFEQEQAQLNPTEVSDHELWAGQHCKFSTGQECRGGLLGCPKEVMLLE